MATVTKGRTFVSGEIVTPAKVNEAFDNAAVTNIQTADIADGQVTTAKIADANVTTSKIADANVTTSKIADANVTTSKIADANVTTAKVQDNAITPEKLSQRYTLATAQNSTSGTSIDFTGVPSWAKRITVMFNGVSTNGTSAVLVQLGTSGGVATSGYLGSSNGENYTTGFSDGFTTASAARHGSYTIMLIGSNTWVCSVVAGTSNYLPVNNPGGFSIALAGALDRIRITTVNGTDTFDAGTINISYEG